MSRKALVKKAGDKRKSGPLITPNRGLLLLFPESGPRHAHRRVAFPMRGLL